MLRARCVASFSRRPLDSKSKFTFSEHSWIAGNSGGLIRTWVHWWTAWCMLFHHKELNYQIQESRKTCCLSSFTKCMMKQILTSSNRSWRTSMSARFPLMSYWSLWSHCAPLTPDFQTCIQQIKKITLLRVIPTMTFQNNHVRFYVSLIGSGEGRHTTHPLKCVLLLSTSQTDWKQSSDILWHFFWHSFWHILWHIFWHIL